MNSPHPKISPLPKQGEPAITSAGQKRLGISQQSTVNSQQSKLFNLLILGDRYFAHQILQLLTVRIHSAIAEKGNTWARLWYLLRGLDANGSSFCKLRISDICQVLGCSSSTVYQWLREGKQVQAFSWYQVKRQGLRVRLGSLDRVSKALGLIDSQGSKISSPWGVVAEVPLHQVNHLRAIATVAVAQKLQQLSRFAAWKSLPPQARKIYKLPQPAEFFGGMITLQDKLARQVSPPFLAESDAPLADEKASQTALTSIGQQQLSHDLPRGRTRCILHIGAKRIFVSKGFVPFGTSQRAIALERGYCDRTIQRQVKTLGVNKRQIVQAKGAYRLIRQAIAHDADSCQPEENISWQVRKDRFDGSGVLTDQSGNVGKTHSTEVRPERFFNYGSKDWIYRCNLYEPSFKLCTMRTSLRKFQKSILQNSSVAGGVTACSEVGLRTKETRRT